MAARSLSDIAPTTFLARLRAHTPARVLAGRTGAAYRTATQLDLREAHAAAADAVRTELDLARGLGEEFVRTWKLFEVQTRACSKEEYLLRPDLGRRLSAATQATVRDRCPTGADLQVVIGDGLSVTAVVRQVPPLLPLLHSGAVERGWQCGQPFVLRYCRVGVMNDIGELLAPQVVVLLIGERPGLSTAESLSAYMAFRPRAGHTDADRNVISNIHAHGVRPQAAADRILRLAEQMRRRQLSGAEIKEEFQKKALP